MLNTKIVTKHFVDAAIWTETDGLPIAPAKDVFDKALTICTAFCKELEPYEARLRDCEAYFSHPDCNGKLEAAIGHDFLLTSQGHGIGFWDRETLPEDLQTTLTNIAHKFEGRFYFDVCDDTLFLDLV